MSSAWETRDPRTYPDYVLALGTATADRLDPEAGLGERLRLVLVEAGGGLLLRDASAWPFRAPAALCLDERERVALQAGPGLRLRLLYFHPSVLHHELTFEALRPPRRAALPVAAGQDAYWLDPFVERGPEGAGAFLPGPLAWERLLGLHRQVDEERAACRDLNWPCRTRSHLIKLLIFLRGLEPAAAPEVPVGDGLVRDLLVQLQAGFDQRLTVAALARRLATNRTTLQERFEAATGRSIMEYLAALRVEVAQALLRDTLLPVTEVGVRVGYADAAAFSRAFRRRVGTAPSEYRDRVGWMARAG